MYYMPNGELVPEIANHNARPRQCGRAIMRWSRVPFGLAVVWTLIGWLVGFDVYAWQQHVLAACVAAGGMLWLVGFLTQRYCETQFVRRYFADADTRRLASFQGTK